MNEFLKYQEPNTFYIVNDFDRPERKLITLKIDDLLYYVHPALQKNYNFGLEMQVNSTPIENFGLNIYSDSYEIFFEQVESTKAIYSNGEPRVWQGEFSFSIPIEWVKNTEKIALKNKKEAK